MLEDLVRILAGVEYIILCGMNLCCVYCFISCVMCLSEEIKVWLMVYFYKPGKSVVKWGTFGNGPELNIIFPIYLVICVMTWFSVEWSCN